MLYVVFLIASALGSESREDPSHDGAYRDRDIFSAEGEPLALRVDLGMGFYVYEVQSPFETIQVQSGGTWEYVDQAIFYDSASDPYAAPRSVVSVPDDPATAASDEEMVASRMRTQRVDWLGRRWQLVEPSNDESYAIPEVIANPTFRQDEVNWVEDTYSEHTLPLSWSTVDCNGGWPSIATHAIWDAESRIQTNYTVDTQLATVEMRLDYGSSGIGRCTGAIAVSGALVLTAGHCLKDGGAVLDPWDVRACTHGNDANFTSLIKCKIATSVAVNPNYSGLGGGFGDADVPDDYGVAVFGSNFIHISQVFGISNLGPSHWDDFWNRHIGYGGNAPGLPASCSPNTTPAAPGFMSPGKRQFRQARNDLQFSAKQVKTKFDGGQGMSGSPFFYCPFGEDCNSNAQIIGVWTNWNSFTARHSGPRAHRFRQFVMDNLP